MSRLLKVFRKIRYYYSSNDIYLVTNLFGDPCISSEVIYVYVYTREHNNRVHVTVNLRLIFMHEPSIVYTFGHLQQAIYNLGYVDLMQVTRIMFRAFQSYNMCGKETWVAGNDSESCVGLYTSCQSIRHFTVYSPATCVP